MNMKSILKHFDRIDASSIDDGKLAKRVSKLQKARKQGGFTLLELLVVVAILAAIAGTATIALQDTDARAAAAAHVAMMDEMNKGIRTFRTLNRNAYPTGFDSLTQVSVGNTLSAPTYLEIGQVEDRVDQTLSIAQFSRLAEVGMDSLMYVAADQDPAGDDNCVFTDGGAEDGLAGLVSSRQNAVVAGNIFLMAHGNGCGVRATFNGSTAANGTDNIVITSQTEAGDPVDAAYTGTLPVQVWNGGAERLTGTAEAGAYNASGNTVFMVVGLGPASSLFNANELGGMTSVPVYRHVGPADYNRFTAVWDIGTYGNGTFAENGFVVSDQPNLTTVVDGAGDTKEEELGEWDGTRNTI